MRNSQQGQKTTCCVPTIISSMVSIGFILLLTKYKYITNQSTSDSTNHFIQMQYNQSSKYILILSNQIIDLKKRLVELQSQVDQLHRNQLTKQEKGMQLFKRFSKKYNLQFSQRINSFKAHYSFNKQRRTITKMTNQQNNALLYSLIPIPDANTYYFQVKIERSQKGAIAIGIFTHDKKKDLDCGYCADNQMYYLYGNGRVYHGKDFSLFYKYENTRFQSFEGGDTISVFIDRNMQHVTWYIDGRYAYSKFLQYNFAKQQLYPFILMADKNDEIRILQ